MTSHHNIMAVRRTDKPKGLLRVGVPPQDTLHHARLLPSAADVAFFIEHYWIVAWDITGQEPRTQETLPYPSIHIAIEEGRSGIYGIVRGKFTRRIEGKGHVFGIKFKPGAFYPFLKSSVSALTDTIVPLAQIFGDAGTALERDILALPVAGEDALIAVAEHFLRARLPAEDDNVRIIGTIIARIIEDREITKVDQVVDALAVGDLRVSKRQIQRLFSLYVGVSPKWVIMRYRLHEAVERMTNGETVDLPRLALDLGYFDQAHFIKDFKAMVGRAPGEYVRSVEGR
jgi:AraC-like DNA-binding protein